MRWCRTRCPPTTPHPCFRCWGRHAAPRQGRWRQRGPAHDTRHAADGAWGYHDGPARRMVPTPHPPACTGPSVGMGHSTTTA